MMKQNKLYNAHDTRNILNHSISKNTIVLQNMQWLLWLIAIVLVTVLCLELWSLITYRSEQQQQNEQPQSSESPKDSNSNNYNETHNSGNESFRDDPKDGELKDGESRDCITYTRASKKVTKKRILQIIKRFKVNNINYDDMVKFSMSIKPLFWESERRIYEPFIKKHMTSKLYSLGLINAGKFAALVPSVTKHMKSISTEYERSL